MTVPAQNHIKHPSPNHDERNTTIDMLVLHYTGMQSGTEALERLCDAEAKVSAHYMIEEDGRIFQLVEEEQRAWHAGVAHWRGDTNINARSVGIEIVNPGHEWGYRDFPEVQIATLIPLCQSIIARHTISARNVVGHSDVAPERKQDPGELFPWERLANEGMGLWPENPFCEGAQRPRQSRASHSEQASLGCVVDLTASSQNLLTSYGYTPDAPLEATITAFQRHFRPTHVNGEWDSECEAIITDMLKSVSS